MTQDEIIRMAREAGIEANEDNGYLEWWNFAKLVAAHAKSDQINTAYQQGCEDMKRRMEKRMQQLESQLQLCQTAVADEREECAKVCDEIAVKEWDAYKGRTEPLDKDKLYNPHIEGISDGADECAAAIRARGEK